MNADDYGARAAARKQLPSRFDLIRFADFKPLDDENDCVKGLLPRRGLAVFWGPPKCGKSFLVFDLLMHVALGWDYRGLTVKQGPIVYLCLEGGRAFRRRREAFRLSKLKEGDDPPFFFVTNPLSLAADHQGLIGDIRRQMGEDIPAVVCIDTLNRSLAGSESDDRDMSAYIKAADALQNAFGCLVVIVHHCGHDAQRPRGHSSLMGALDVQIAVSRDAEGNVVAELELAKDGEAGVVFVSRLEPVEVGRDAHGAPVVSCVVKEIEDDVAKTAAKKRGRGERGDDVAKVKHALAEAYGRLADAVETSLGFGGESVKKVPVGKLRDEVKSRGFLEADDDGNLTSTARKHFQRAKTGLIASKRFIEADGKFWRLVHD
ncbi:MAG TPA: AAA family ATPase [Roseiarcus sp.]